MPYDAAFNSNARKILDYNTRLNSFFQEGRIDELKFREKKKLLHEKLALLKKKNLELINKDIESLEGNIKRLEQQLADGSINGSQHDGRLEELDGRKMDFESEKNLIELCDGEGYIKYLKGHLDLQDVTQVTGRGYGNATPAWMQSSDSGNDGRVPLWATAVAVVMTAVAALIGILGGSILNAIVMAVVLWIVLAVGVAILHISAKVAGLGNATIEEAFTCTIANVLATVFLNILFTILSLVMLAAGPAACLIGLVLAVARIALSIAFYAGIIRHFYNTSWSTAAMVLIVQTVIGVVIAVVFLLLGFGALAGLG